uniref:Putative ovule protein n=1 Tax=Solanum chacoense TaxID=4108 RepID=A0A0V0I919_SOLCH
MEGISLMLHRVMTLNWIKWFKTGTTRLDRVKVSYVLYAIDILISCGAKEKFRYLRAILLLFESVSV